ncbi:MAG TPA: hypothetical protein VF708_19955 [Pyrinomonadaceae bacterium]|jgi:hypothetical protein
MSTYGRRILATTGRVLRVAASMLAHWKTGGVTIAWATVAAAGADTTLPDDTPIKAGQRFLRYGQILCRIVTTEVQTLDLSGDDDPTGGTWDITDLLGEEILGIAWNVSAAALQAAIRAVDIDGIEGTTVEKVGFVYTITFPKELGDVPAITVDASGLTGGVGDTFAITVTTAQPGGNFGKYGPYDPAATDGRQLLTRGECFILNETVVENGVAGGLDPGVTDHPAVFDGGPAWKARILMTTGAHSLAAGPTVTEFEAAFPRIEYVQDK